VGFSLSIILAAAGVLALTSCAQGKGSLPGPSAVDESRNTLRLYISQSPDTLNPLLANSVTTKRLASLFYDPLVAPDADNRLRPALAAVVPTLANGGISRDGRTVTFRLRKGVRWHDGRPFTSADVLFTFAKINDPAAEVADRTGYDRIARTSAPDPFTVVVTLKEPFAPFVVDVGYGYPILPAHMFAKSTDFNRDPLRSQPVGTGPYRLIRWDRGNRIELGANAAYFGGRPRINTVTIAELPDATTVALALRTDLIDFAQVEPAVFAQLREQPNLRASTEPANTFVSIALNTTSPILRDVRMRRALSMAIDRVTLCKKLTLGTGAPAYADLPANLWRDPEPVNPYGYDPNAANAMLDAAGWRRGPSGFRERGGVPLRLRNVAANAGQFGQSIAAQVQQMLEAVGIAWSTKYYNVSQYFAPRERGGVLAKGDFDTASFSGLGGADSQNDEFYRCANREPVGPNAALYCSPRMETLQEASLRTLDPVRRAADVVKIEELAVTDVPYIFLFHVPRDLIWNRRLHRSRANVEDTWYDIAHWWLSPR
jgi:peptide/nickel transport system substrate-binding protein